MNITTCPICKNDLHKNLLKNYAHTTINSSLSQSSKSLTLGSTIAHSSIIIKSPTTSSGQLTINPNIAAALTITAGNGGSGWNQGNINIQNITNNVSILTCYNNSDRCANILYHVFDISLNEKNEINYIDIELRFLNTDKIYLTSIFNNETTKISMNGKSLNVPFMSDYYINNLNFKKFYDKISTYFLFE